MKRSGFARKKPAGKTGCAERGGGDAPAPQEQAPRPAGPPSLRVIPGGKEKG